MKAAIATLSLFALLPCALADDAKPPASRLPANCEVVMPPGMTPLMSAAEGLRENVVQLLLDRGADVDANGPGSLTALQWAKEIGGEDRQGVIRKLEAAVKKSDEHRSGARSRRSN